MVGHTRPGEGGSVPAVADIGPGVADIGLGVEGIDLGVEGIDPQVAVQVYHRLKIRSKIKNLKAK